MIMDINAHIKDKFRVKGKHTFPYTGWLISNRDHIAELFGELGFKVGAEIGVRMGGYSAVICMKNPGVKLYCIDLWTSWEGGRPSQDKQDMYFEHAKRKLEGYDVTFLRKTSMEALADIPDDSLDFVYVDAKHDFDDVMMDIICWSRKVHSGGIVSGHDYIHLHNCGVIPAVRAYVEGHNIFPWYLTQDVPPSFFWVKP